ncbi:MAG: tripartite tricarboxylate transporter substrate binding protein [Firmicutes bacterium]|nr:tripartite tricarboxylate transporter substrate binding protein [Bacillota bacterium]
MSWKSIGSKLLLGLVCVSLVATLAGCGGTTAKYPEKPMTLVLGWAAGGMTDRVMRFIGPIAEKELGQPFVITNMPGATSAIAMQHVFSQKPDGYTILGGSENPALFQVLDVSPRNYDEYDPIMLLAMSIPCIVVEANAPWKDIKEFIAAAKAKPGGIKLGNTGIGGQPHVTGSMMKAGLGVEFAMVPYDGEGPTVTATIGKHVDFTIAGATAAVENMRAGKIRILATFTNEKVPLLPGVPALGEEFPEMKKYLPWGAWYGVFVKKGTPQNVKDRLTAAFKKAIEDPKWKEFTTQMVANPLSLSGDDAVKFIKKWQSVTTWTLHEAGAAKKSPADFNIPKP